MDRRENIIHIQIKNPPTLTTHFAVIEEGGQSPIFFYLQQEKHAHTNFCKVQVCQKLLQLGLASMNQAAKPHFYEHIKHKEHGKRCAFDGLKTSVLMNNIFHQGLEGRVPAQTGGQLKSP